MLRIAVPNKGSLSEPAAAMLREAGYRTRRDPKELVVNDVDNGVELFYLRPRDIAVYVGSGTVDCGITGRDLLLDSGSAAVEVMGLGFGASTFRYAARPGTATALADVAGHRVATSYPGLVEKHLADHGVPASVVRLDGAVETAITLGVADVIADVVETGQTLRSQGLEVFGEPILRSEAVLVRREGSEEKAAVEVLRRRLLGVITARHYVMLDYDVPATLVDAGLRHHPRPGVADRVAPAEPRLVRGARDGAALGHQRRHGRALRPGRPCHPRHRHHRLPAVSDPVPTAAGRPLHPTEPDAPFRPRRGRVLPLVMATVAVVVCTVVAIGMGASGAWRVGDQLALVGLGLALAAFLGRYASIRAVPDEAGLTVRNLMLTRTVTWDEVIEVRFPDGAPWVSLELDDGDELAVMAIQRADGPAARDEAMRLARIVDRHWRSREP